MSMPLFDQFHWILNLKIFECFQNRNKNRNDVKVSSSSFITKCGNKNKVMKISSNSLREFIFKHSNVYHCIIIEYEKTMMETNSEIQFGRSVAVVWMCELQMWINSHQTFDIVCSFFRSLYILILHSYPGKNDDDDVFINLSWI